MIERWIDIDRHPIDSTTLRATCRRELDRTGALVLKAFFRDDAVATVVDRFASREDEAFYAASTHNVWLTPGDDTLATDHVMNRQIVSTKGLIADDQIPDDSALRLVYDDERFRSFIASTVGLNQVFPYDDDLSSVNMHFHRDGQELGWHFDNSAFAVTALFQAPHTGGHFEFVAELRDAEAGDQNFDGVEAVLNGEREPQRLALDPGDLIVFRGRNALHRVTPSQGDRTRMLAVLAFNESPGIALSESARGTFYGRDA